MIMFLDELSKNREKIQKICAWIERAWDISGGGTLIV